MHHSDNREVLEDLRKEGSTAEEQELEREEAIDDSADADPREVKSQQNVAFHRRGSISKETRIENKLPFRYSPLFRPLNVTDLDSCVALENAAFTNESHRATPGKLKYRLSKCPELSMGIFCTVPRVHSGANFELETLATARPVETGREDYDASALIAHVVSTRSTHDVVTDSDMDYPRDWETNHQSSELGHHEEGRTICLHSLAVVPTLQWTGLGSQIMRAYLQEMNKEKGETHSVDRVVLLCQYPLISYYQRFGFEHVGKSEATFAGGEWHDMVGLNPRLMDNNVRSR
ncbi:polyamine acetyltransferase [Zalerion maritima]|uniref:Polyamine acetyltransferase n=1 Tax=Zalerion maritima TaxID=339359 RepID=A0AAD5WWA2_9PEZI|nr:polyamine acetyltransferase [Zalerion maritima]